MISFVFLAFSLLLSTSAWAGAPRASLEVATSPVVALGAPIRVELFANCTGRIPPRLDRDLRLLSRGSPVAGRWMAEQGLIAATGSRARFRFVPEKPLPAGTYTVAGLPPDGGDASNPGARGERTVRVEAPEDSTPPLFRGLEGATCEGINPLLGCTPAGLHLSLPKAEDRSPVRYVVYLRKPGEPYRADLRFEADVIPLGPAPFGERLERAARVLTVQAVDASDNEGGEICELQLTLPASSCRGWTNAPPKRLTARCAVREPNAGTLRSAIDGVVLDLSGARRKTSSQALAK